MKRDFKYPAFVALLLVALAGCQREPMSGSGDAICFSVDPVSVSMAATKTVSEIPTDGVGLVSDGSSSLLYGTIGSDTPVFSTGTTLNCSMDGSTATWSYTNGTRYWVRGGAYSFRAVYPSTASVTGNGDQVAVSYNMAAMNYDLMVGSACVTTAPPTGNSVDLQFIHACAAVRFLFKDENGTTAPGFSLKSFSLQHLATSGKFTCGTTSAWGDLNSPLTETVYSWTGSWSVPATYAVFDGLYDTGWYFVIPQTLDDSSAISLTYQAGEDTQVFQAQLPLNPISEWEAGMVYTYKIRLQAGAIGFTVSSTDWDDSPGATNLTEY